MNDQDEVKLAKKSWFARHKVLTVVLVIMGGIVVLGVLGGGGSSTDTDNRGDSGATPTTRQYRFMGRVDAQPKDIEIVVGENATLEGLKLTVNDITRTSAVSEFEKAESGKEFVIVDVSLENVSDKTEQYSYFDFRIQTAAGQVLDTSLVLVDGRLGSGDLVAGGKVAGKVTFEVPKEEGHQYLIYKPNAWKADRIIVQVQ
ncbi:hypothetical protein B5M47_03785 [candidate division CPR3 bacterium 4484_211]|uniref:DUF4352 domain-containing protein n=1 Tax=candidate division CPR3 bacterium 4484_211 TaxID=1968527 RepID=A0A1W9NWT6_UNCC3|nr:MAG: hypothetical protein B5M47_03785 [candidate division CPR3 bacterium 4484_211]